MWRKFEPHVEELAQRCFDEPVVSTTFNVDGGIEGGGTASRRITIDGLLAWAKPARIAADNGSSVAHEKIAHDLAFKLGLPVAPARIVKDHKVPDFPSIVAVSYQALKSSRPWQNSTMNAEQKASVASSLGAMRAFHAWIDDHDHDWSENNAQIELVNDQSARPVFFDYSFSLTRMWTPPAAPPTRAWDTKNGPYAHMDNAGAFEIIEKICSLAIKDIEDIIMRLPDGLLAQSLSSALVTGLEKRRGALKDLLKL